MLGTLWQLFKLLRYLIPFLNEVADEHNCSSEEDKLKALKIKKTLRVYLFRLIFFVIFCIIVFWVALPLYTQNAILKQELQERVEIIERLEGDKEKAVLNQYSAMNNTHLCNVKLDNVIEENKRLTNRILEIQQTPTVKIGNQAINPLTVRKPKTTTNKIKPIKPTTVKPTLPEGIHRRLNNIE